MTTNLRRPLVLALALCAVSDLAAVPPLLSADDGPPAAVGVLVGLLGLATLVAVVGMARGCDRPRPLAWITRVADLGLALPALGSGADSAVIAASAVTVGLSAITIALLVMTRPAEHPVAT